MVTKPPELAHAEFVLGLCDRFHKLPSEIYQEDTELLRLIHVEQFGKPEEHVPDGGEEQWPTR